MPVLSKAQYRIEHINLLWEGYYNTVRFNKKWSLVSDAQIRTKDWSGKWSQLLIRSGLSNTFNEHTTVTAGVAFFKNAQYKDKQFFLKNEWRPWEEFSYRVKLNKINFIQRLRTEQRFLQQVINNNKSNHYDYIFRLRYRFELQLPFKTNNLKLMIGNEVLVNPGYINNTLFFDQNRTFTGLQVKLSPKTSLQCQYLKIFQWHSNTSVLDDQNVYRLNIYQEFLFGKKKL